MIGIALATEDELSESIGKRLIDESQSGLRVDLNLRKNGSGYLRSKMDSWCQIANTQPVLLITDLDAKTCAADLVDTWLGGRVRPIDLVFRVAVREVEAWLLADHEGMTRLLGRRTRLPADPDTLPDPKMHLIRLAKTAPRDVRDDLVATREGVCGQGLGYNARLAGFVSTDWDPSRAAVRSESLRRARRRIDELGARKSSGA